MYYAIHISQIELKYEWDPIWNGMYSFFPVYKTKIVQTIEHKECPVIDLLSITRFSKEGRHGAWQRRRKQRKRVLDSRVELRSEKYRVIPSLSMEMER